MATRKKLPSSAVAFATSSNAVASASVSSAKPPIGRLTAPSHRLTKNIQASQVSELRMIMDKLFSEESEKQALLDLKLNGLPFFTLKERGVLLDVKAIYTSIGFEGLMEYLVTVKDVKEVSRTSPLLEKVQEQLLIEDEMAERGNEKIEESNYTCPRAGCNNKKIGFYQKQTRSADEGMTTFLRCTVCNRRWTERG